MDADDVVTACIRALELDEAICVPALEAPGEIEALHAAQRALMVRTRTTTLAERYR